MLSARRPQRCLRFQRPNHSIVIEHVNALIQSTKPRLMRKQLPERDLVLVCLAKLRPELSDGPVELNLLLLQRMQYTRAANSFRCRPNQHGGVGAPRFLATGIAKSAVKINQRFTVLPNRKRRAEFAESFKVLIEQRFQSLKNLAGFQLHCLTLTRSGVFPKRRLLVYSQQPKISSRASLRKLSSKHGAL